MLYSALEVKMSSKNNIMKSMLNVVESIKDNIQQDLLRVVSSQHVKLDMKDLQQLIVVIGSAVDAGFHKGAKSIEKVIDKELE